VAIIVRGVSLFSKVVRFPRGGRQKDGQAEASRMASSGRREKGEKGGEGREIRVESALKVERRRGLWVPIPMH